MTAALLATVLLLFHSGKEMVSAQTSNARQPAAQKPAAVTIPPPPGWKVSAPIQVEVPDVGIIEFPAGMTLQEIEAVLRRKFPPRQAPVSAAQPATNNNIRVWTPADTEIPPPPDASKEQVAQWEAARRKQEVDWNEQLKHIPLQHIWSPSSDADCVGRDVVSCFTL